MRLQGGPVALTDLLAIVAAGLIAGVAVLQVALALGVPLGAMTMGGRAPTVAGVLTRPFRVAAAASAVVLVLSAWVVLARTGMATVPVLNGDVVGWLTWAIVVFLAVNSATNLSGSHPVEKYGLTAVTVIAGLCVAGVALGA